MDHPADLVNVALETLIRARRELPAFSTLDRLVRRVRYLVHQRVFAQVVQRCPPAPLEQPRRAAPVAPPPCHSGYQRLKEAPKRPTLRHLQALLDRLAWMAPLADTPTLLAGLPAAKLRHFAAEAKALDAAEMRNMTAPKRTTLLLALLHRARVQGIDDLATMFCKRIATIHRPGRKALEAVRIRHRAKTDPGHRPGRHARRGEQRPLRRGGRAAGARAPGSAGWHPAPARRLRRPGGLPREQLPAAPVAPLRSHRPTLFRLARLLEFLPTSQDRSLVASLEWLLARERKRGEWLDGALDLSFAPERWQQALKPPVAQAGRLNRRLLDVCLFSCLADELRSGDVAIRGSDAYADYREQLLSREVCEPLRADYCRDLGFPATAQGFVQHLREWLTTAARAVDAGSPANRQIAIGPDGIPVLRRTPARPVTAAAVALEAALRQRMPERNLLDVLCNVEHWTRWTRHFGPLSGSDPKLEHPVERYILTAFTYGCNLGPAQAARHLRGIVTPHMLSFVNRRHVTAQTLSAATTDVLNGTTPSRCPRSGRRDHRGGRRDQV